MGYTTLLFPEQLEAWKQLQVTQIVFQFLMDKRQELMEQWASQMFCHHPNGQTLNAVSVGHAEAFNYVATQIDFEEIRSFYSKEKE